MNLKKIIMIGLLALGVSSQLAIAHDDATLDKMETPHGGKLRMAGQYHFELVNNSAQKLLTVYVTDHNNTPIPTKNLSGQMMIVQQGHKLSLPLKPDTKQVNALVAVGNIDLSKSHISITIDNQTARYQF